MELRAQISEDERHLDVTFNYDPYVVETVKRFSGARFVPVQRGGPLWRFPLSVQIGVDLRREFGNAFKPSRKYRAWAMKEKRVATSLISLSSGDSAELKRLPDLLPELHEALFLGPVGLGMDIKLRNKKLKEEKGSFQTADTAFLAACPYPVNTNQPGTGKTLEVIGSVFESGDYNGPKLVIAPLTSLELVWEYELISWQWQDIIMCFGNKRRREDAIAAAVDYAERGEPFWFVTNPATIQYNAVYEETPEGKRIQNKRKLFLKHPELHEIEWDLVVLDEFHQMGLGNPDTLTARAVYDLKRKKGMGMSGTPIGGKPVKFFGILKFVDPDNHTSKYNFATQWLVVEDTAFGKKYGDVRKEREEDFWNYIGKYMIRRTKEEVLPWLPPKQRIDMWATMEGYQLKQYETFAENAEIKIEEEALSATSILAEYTRLKQFAVSAQKLETIKDPPYFKPYPTEQPGHSCKLPILEEILKERAIITKGTEDEWDGQQVVVFSQFTVVVDWLYRWLSEQGVRVAKITGDVSAHERTEVVRSFQSEAEDRPQVCLMNTKAGGVSITLDNADTVVFMDETWVPDDQEQAEDRIHRASRIHQVTSYFIRTRGTIEEYIHRRVQGKANINTRILDLRREGLRANRPAREVA